MGVAAKSAQNTQVELGKFGKSMVLSTLSTGAENFLWVQEAAWPKGGRSQSNRGNGKVRMRLSKLLWHHQVLFQGSF